MNTSPSRDPGSTTKIILIAPLSGPLVPIERVPDPVFAQKMVGDGISIDPLDQCLRAPCDGEITQLHPAGHAVTVTTPQGIEVLMHIGLDTVQLKGVGFTIQVQLGDAVKTGDALIDFDADYIATHAKSLLTQIVIANSERVAAFAPRTGQVISGQDTILELTLAGSSAEEVVEAAKAVKTLTSEAIVIPNPTGLHARPAAVLANLAKKFKADIRLRKGDQQGNAKSVVAIMGLEIGHGDKVTVIAKGDDADAVIETLTPLLWEGLGDEGCQPAPAPASVEVSPGAAPAPRPRSEDPNLLIGVAASPGLAVGEVFQIRHEEIHIPEEAEGNPQQERSRLDAAVNEANAQLEALQARLHGERAADKAAIFAAHQELLDDPDLLDIAHSALAKGKSAEFAWQRAFTTHADRLASLRNELLAARANDLRDVGRRVLILLIGAEPERQEPPLNAILVAEELTPSDTASLDRSKVRGFCTTLGGATSHVAILARSLDIPAVAGIEPRALELENGTPVILDGGKGTLRLNPTPEKIAQIRETQERLAIRRQAEMAVAHEPAITLDGHRMEVVANIGGLAEAEQVASLGGEGVGLLRSEFLFLERSTAPSEDEQFETYKSIIEALGPDQPLIIRTLDVGGDKPLIYLPIPKEENPFLGERGLRIGLDRPQILRTQLRAILRAADLGKVRVMFPMVGLLSELRDAKAMLEEERQRLGAKPIEVGIMVEIPAAAIMAAQFAREVDFFSIGTNDLTQYTLAMDRGHPKLAPKVDGLNPSVLRLIAWTVDAAHAQGKWVGVCGGIASDPQAVPLLIGLGVDELSVSLPTIPSIKAQIRALWLHECKELARRALTLETAAEVRIATPAPSF
ncbi:MAG: phosphoenolpyruvate--protein phosphotransferase [Phycisphaerales bacterium]|nr:phosphoenolpyruvate--protein phosphotransferase [Phycisphaerales bacterium]